MNNVYTISYVIIKLYSENVKNTWVEHIIFKSKNSKMYKLHDTHILISKYNTLSMIKKKIYCFMGKLMKMGLFDAISKSKKFNKESKWKQGIRDTIIELNEDYMELITPTSRDTIFYNDIVSVDAAANTVNIRTNAKTFTLRSKSIRGGSEKAEILYTSILRKMKENK